MDLFVGWLQSKGYSGSYIGYEKVVWESIQLDVVRYNILGHWVSMPCPRWCVTKWDLSIVNIWFFFVFLGDLRMKLNYFTSRSNWTTICQLKCVIFAIQEINCEEMNIWLLACDIFGIIVMTLIAYNGNEVSFTLIPWIFYGRMNLLSNLILIFKFMQ